MGGVEPLDGDGWRSPSLAAVLSFVWPGLGQLYLRRRRTALAFALPALLVVVLAVRELLQGPVSFALSMLSSQYALGVAVAVIVVGAWRAVAVIHASIVGSRDRGGGLSRIDTAVLGILLVAILVMHSIPAYFALLTVRTTIDVAQPMPSLAAYSSPDPSEAPEFHPLVPGQTFYPPAPSSPTRRETILIVGVDYGPGRDHSLTDTMLLVSANLDAGKVAMVSVPRDTTMFQLYWNGGDLGPTFKLNALVTGVSNGWFESPDDPWTTLKKEIGYIVGIPVDYYAVMDMAGFMELIDLVGGVDVYNPRTFYDSSEDMTFREGTLHLDGILALLFVRSRYADNDYYRAGRQQAVLIALEKKLASPDMLARLPSFLSLAGRAIHTDYPLDQVKGLASFAESLDPRAISTCVLGPPYSWHPDSTTTRGVWTSRLDMEKVAALSAYLFSRDSAYWQTDVQPASCGS